MSSEKTIIKNEYILLDLINSIKLEFVMSHRLELNSLDINQNKILVDNLKCCHGFYIEHK